MNSALRKKIIISNPDDSLKSIVQKMSKHQGINEVALIVNKKMILKGIINYADVIRFLSKGKSLEKKAKDLMIKNPITAKVSSSKYEIFRTVRSKLSNRTNGRKLITRFVPLVDNKMKIFDVVDMHSLMSSYSGNFENVEIYGLGFVGLTLAVALAGRGHFINGIDNNRSKINLLRKGKVAFSEPMMPDILKKIIKNKQINFHNKPSKSHSRVVIIAVGTPVKKNGAPDLENIKEVCKVVGPRLWHGDLVMVRSTLPVGTTRNIVLKTLKKFSGLNPGKDFYIAFTPERTVEGQALKELYTLPQIIGGLSKLCAEQAAVFWQTLTPNIVYVNSLEDAEFVKLINNSYRDLSFAFSNGLSLMSDKLNLNAHEIISAANEGYPRNLIPQPSPGVGGYCLTKDPFIYSSFNLNSIASKLSKCGRKANVEARKYPIKVIRKYLKFIKKPFSKTTILIAGLAFKGLPETNDMRCSASLEIAKVLLKKKCKVLGFDSVVSNIDIKKHGIKPVDLISGIKKCDIFLILNNNPYNIPERLLENLEGKRVLIFDGWSLLDRQSVEQKKNLYYATMGYITNFKY